MSVSIRITSDLHGKSLLQVLAMKLEHSSKSIKRAIDAYACFVNGRIQRFASKKMIKGDRVLFYLDRFTPLKGGFQCLLEEKDFSLWYKNVHAVCDDRFALHRLDKETSGLILTSDHEEMYELFKKRQISKEYLAIVEGEVREESGVIENKIGLIKRQGKRKHMGVCPEGRPAITKWRVLSRNNYMSLLSCEPVTGRTHQIRVHLQAVGHPILGDYQYAEAFSHRAPRMMLHAQKLAFCDPEGKEQTFTSDMPEDFQEFLPNEFVNSVIS